MVTREQPFSDRFLNMSSEQRRAHLEESVVEDRSALPVSDLEQSDRMLERARRNLKAAKEKDTS